MATAIEILARRWRGNPWLFVPYIASAFLLVSGLVLFWYDTTTSYYGVALLPVNMPDEPIFLIVLALLPQLVQLVFGYALASMEMSDNMRYTFVSVVVIALTIDTATGMGYFYDGSGWLSMGTSFALSLFVFSMFSELAITFCAGFLWALKSEFLQYFRTSQPQQQQRRVAGGGGTSERQR